MDEILRLLNPHWDGKEIYMGIERKRYLSQLDKEMDTNPIVLITGLRRTGKTTILHQLIQKLIRERGVDPKKGLYVAMDHLALEQHSIPEILENFRRMHNIGLQERIYVFLDEIQYIPRWDQQIKNIYDFENTKIVLSGSSATILRSQSGFLTGRFVKFQIRPLNFSEYLLFKKIDVPKLEKYRFEYFMDEYLYSGGLPEYVLFGDVKYLNSLIENIVSKDVVKAFAIRHPSVLNNLLLLMSERVGSKTSFNKLKNILGLSLDTIKEYVNYLEMAYLIRRVERFSYSVNERVYSPAKYYFSDTGLRTALCGRKKDIGAIAENCLYLFLEEISDEVFYYSENDEVDFIARKGDRLIAVESRYGSASRSINGLVSFCEKHKLKNGFVITKGSESKEKIKDIQIIYIPLWKLLLENMDLFVL